MNKILLTITFIILSFIQGCIEAPKNARKSTASNITSTTTTSTTSTTPTFASDEDLYWFSAAKTVGTITINQSTQNIYYLRGKNVHTFLNTKYDSNNYFYNKQFCLVGKFSSTSYKEFRIRATPITSTSSTNVTERMLRLDFPVNNDNSDACSKNLYDITTLATTVYDSTKTVFSLPKVCTNCSGKITTTSISLFTIPSSASTNITSILSKNLLLTGSQIQIDLDSSSTTDSSICSNSACSAKGFDCCIEGQCVKDGTQKNFTSVVPSEIASHTQALTEYAANPLSFINWPTYFNICTNISHPSPTTTPANTAQSLATAQDRVTAYMKSWYCMEDVSTLSSFARCIGTTVSGSSLAYDQVRFNLAKSCGCTSTTVELMDIKCPNWTVKPLYKGSIEADANIVDFYCYTPKVENQVGAITNLNVSVSTRSAPHRYFSSAGKNHDDLSLISASEKLITTQESDIGDEDFSYLDELNKSNPNNGSFNYKSILGTMNIDLSKTAPAKMVAVELGKTYILTSLSGYFTPCPLCTRDSWFQSFFSRPSSQRGTGLQFSGYSTQRDAFGNNETLGNYEDTHFGRACFLPMTMIPLSHQKSSTIQTQRLNRLKTQAAYYINGYQRDWFGFNQGALIGSFDGVTWFAVGTGRRITATTSKLFLAINGSFLDLASKSDIVVNIIPDTANNTAPNVDFDPDLNLKDPLQGTAATCQKFHQCNTDAECVSNLGWEYVCTDVSQLGTTWPLFDSTGAEIKNTERSGTLFDILSTTISTTYTKRCVYRGAGAPCKKDFSTFNTSGNSTYKKALTCAPNFYCASVSINKFNSEVARSPNELDNILFGMDTNVLGRPLNYVTGSKLLPTQVQENIIYAGKNGLRLNATEASDLGMCRPGKQLIASPNIANFESDYVRAHSNADSQKRTDYISQIGSCNSTVTSANRVLTCPQFGSDSNYLDPKEYDVADSLTNPIYLSNQQNFCSGEARHTTSNLSAFRSFEAGSLSTTNSIPSPTLALDACLRRAGSVCHTDLDCGPNTMHESIASSLSLTYYGGTDAERSYWSESLICGQAESQPLKNSSKYLSYDLSMNKCCREIGKDFTMFTQGDANFIPDQIGVGNTSLQTGKFSYLDPKASNRYSRYSVAPSAFDTLSSNSPDTASSMIPKVPNKAVGIHEPKENQWRVFNETGKSTCCGGGFIRKFADGTHTWPIKDRLSIDATNFSCLNFRSPLTDPDFASKNPAMIYSPPTTTPGLSRIVNASTYQNDYDRLCRYPSDGGCMQIPYKDFQNFTIFTPEPYFAGDQVDRTEILDGSFSGLDDLSGSDRSRMDTSPTKNPSEGDYGYRVYTDAPYEPISYEYANGVGKFEGKLALPFLFNEDFGYGGYLYLPTYIGYTATVPSLIKKVYIKYYYDQSNGVKLPKVQDITALTATNANCQKAINYPNPSYPVLLPISAQPFPADELTAGGTTAKWCVGYSARSQNRPVLIVRGDTTLAASGGVYDGWIYAGIVIDFQTIERYEGTKVTVPGNPLYYLTKLARLDLLGIPQITYEPLYCNNNHNNVVPGIFKSSATEPLKTRTNFTSTTYTYNYSSADPIEMYNADSSTNDSEVAAGYGNAEERFVYQDKVDHPAIFSSKDFTCCTPLGMEPKNGAGSCCSGNSVTKNNKTLCTLPTGTDLNVYFNRFVSNEGNGLISKLITDADGDGINEISTADAENNIDFISQTGEPKNRDTTHQKIFSLGVAHCSSGKVITGSAFGKFAQEPFTTPVTFGTTSGTPSFIISIVDSVIDNFSQDPLVSKLKFDSGFRWNQHWYCQ